MKIFTISNPFMGKTIDAFDDYLENTYPDGITATGLDELLWNDNEMEEIFKEIGIETSERKIKKQRIRR